MTHMAQIRHCAGRGHMARTMGMRGMRNAGVTAGRVVLGEWPVGLWAGRAHGDHGGAQVRGLCNF